MLARSTHQEAQARILEAFTAQLHRVTPEDERVPLKGATLAGFEDQVDTLPYPTLALNEGWRTHLDGKQIQRWAEAIGRTVASARAAEVRAFERGCRPATPTNAPMLLVIGMDGGGVETREKQGGNVSWWRKTRLCREFS